MHFAQILLALSLIGVFTLPSVSFAENTRFTVDNFLTLPHPQVVSFSVFEDGSASGILRSGTPFTQVNVPNDLGIRVQQFQIDDHRHFIIEGNIAYTLEEFSIELARAYNDKQNRTT